MQKNSFRHFAVHQANSADCFNVSIRLEDASKEREQASRRHRLVLEIIRLRLLAKRDGQQILKTGLMSKGVETATNIIINGHYWSEEAADAMQVLDSKDSVTLA